MSERLNRPYENSRISLESERYEFFSFPEERQEIFNYSRKIAEYLRSENIPNLVIIDRSSRPIYIGVREYLRSKYPKEKIPNIYFLNPKGFKAKETLSEHEIKEIVEDCEWKDDLSESPRQVRNQEQILDEFKEVYKKLLEDKEKPVLVFDTCIHSGGSLRPVKEALGKTGFSDIRIGAVNPSKSSQVETDFFITNIEPEKGCYPFDRDRMIEKTFDHVYSKRTDSAQKRERSLNLRKEIKRIMNDFLVEEK